MIENERLKLEPPLENEKLKLKAMLEALLLDKEKHFDEWHITYLKSKVIDTLIIAGTRNPFR